MRYGLAIVLSCLLLCFSACSRKDEPLPVAAPTSVASATSAGAKAQAWFASQKSAATSQKSSTASRTEGDTQPAIDWEHAIYSDEYVAAPFADTDNPFTASQYAGYRFLVVRTAGDSCIGRIVGLITRQPTIPDKATYLALTGTKPLLAGRLPGPVDAFTGALLVYSPQYTYQAGLAYDAGTPQPVRMSLYTAVPGIPPPDTSMIITWLATTTQAPRSFMTTSFRWAPAAPAASLAWAPVGVAAAVC